MADPHHPQRPQAIALLVVANLFWGMSFPLAAFSALTLRLANTSQGHWLQLPALGLLALTSLVILGLTLGTWRGLRQGSLLVADA